MTTAGCTTPGTVTPETLLAYIDGEAPSGAVRHIESCPACAAEASGLARLQRALGESLFRFDCPPSQTLGEYALDLVSTEDRTTIAQHVLDCARCTLDLRGLREFLATDDLVAPQRSGVLDGLRRIVATLFVPAPAAAPAVALRGGGAETAQTYRAGDLTLTLGPGAQARRGNASLMGLLVREDGDLDVPPGSTARLLAPTGTATSTEIDELGNFAFDDLAPAPATYLLELRLGADVVVVESVQVAR